jgi:hypothetical protein
MHPLGQGGPTIHGKPGMLCPDVTVTRFADKAVTIGGHPGCRRGRHVLPRAAQVGRNISDFR